MTEWIELRLTGELTGRIPRIVAEEIQSATPLEGDVVHVVCMDATDGSYGTDIIRAVCLTDHDARRLIGSWPPHESFKIVKVPLLRFVP